MKVELWNLTGVLCIICCRKSCCHLVGYKPPGLYYLEKTNQVPIGPAANIQNKLAKEQYDGPPEVSILE